MLPIIYAAGFVHTNETNVVTGFYKLTSVETLNINRTTIEELSLDFTSGMFTGNDQLQDSTPVKNACAYGAGHLLDVDDSLRFHVRPMDVVKWTSHDVW